MSLSARSLPVCLLLLLACPALAQTPLTCTATGASPVSLRVEGIAEPAADILFDCTGGTPIVTGAPLPAVNVQAFFSTKFTSRIVYSNVVDWSEALLLVDNPLPGQERPCLDPSGVCTVLSGAPVPNIYQGVLSASNSVSFSGIPFNPPGPGAHRLLRITNLRVNALELGYMPPIPYPVNASLAISGGLAVNLVNPQVTVGFIQTGLKAELRSADDATVLAAPVDMLSCYGTTQRRIATFHFTEVFPSSFKPRTAAAYSGTETSPPPAAQNVPGTLYHAESQYFNPNLPAGAANRNAGSSGLASAGTRLRAVFTNVPSGVTLHVSTVPVTFTAGVPAVNAASGPQARLIDPAQPVFTPIAAGGNLGGVPVAAVRLSGGAGEAVWEVLQASPGTLDDLVFPIHVSYAAGSQSYGSASVGLAFSPPSGVQTASASEPLPRFANSFTAHLSALISIGGACLCPYSLNTPSVQVTGAGMAMFTNLVVTTYPSCPWSASTDVPWIHFFHGSSFTGTAALNYAFDPNPYETVRTGTITAAGLSFTVVQSGWSTMGLLNPVVQAFSQEGGSGVFTVSAPGGTAWTSVSSAPWVRIGIGAIGTGYDIVAYSVDPNPATTPRSATITVAGNTHTIQQEGYAANEPAGATLIPSLPYMSVQNTAGATGNPADPVHSCTGMRDSATVWYRYVATFTGTLRLSTETTGYDTVLAVYPGTTAPGAEIACNNDAAPPGITSQLDVRVTAGQSYLFQVSLQGITSGGAGQLYLKVLPLGGHPALDINVDGKSDLLWQHPLNGDIWHWTLNPPVVQNYAYIGWNATYRAVASGDLNADGELDLIVQHPTNGDAFVWFLRRGAFVSYASLSGPTPFRIAGLNEFNGDGRLDILWQHPSTGQAWIWYMNGARVVSAEAILSSPTYRIVATGDVNGDGKPDIIWQHPVNRDVWVWHMNFSTYVSSLQLAGPMTYDIAGVGDFNGDGKLDLLWQHPTNGDVWAWYLNNGVYTGSAPVAGPMTYKVYGWR